jgi:protoporphyrinogen oxidase
MLDSIDSVIQDLVDMSYRYAILGGGVLGLTAALRLLERGHDVTVYEQENEPGGLAAGFIAHQPSNGSPVWLEKFYHHIFESDRTIIRMIREVGVGDHLEFRRPLTVSLIDGKVYQLDSALSVLQFDPISLIARLRMGAGIALLRALPSPDPLEGRTTAKWVRQVMGLSAFQKVWGPLLNGKFGKYAEEIALPWFWARVHDRTPKLGYIRGGFQIFYNALADKVRVQGGTVHLGTIVQRAEHTRKGYDIQSARVAEPKQTRKEKYQRVISTLPLRLTCNVIPELNATDFQKKYEWGDALGAHCLIVALNHQLTDSYWMNINDPGYPFLALVEHTNYMPREDYGGQHLVYLGNYRSMDDRLFRLSKEEVLQEYLPHLQRINPDFRPDWITQSWMFSSSFAQPVVTTAYKSHIPPFDTPLPGLYLANMFQVYPHDRGQNYSIELAEKLVEHLEKQE